MSAILRDRMESSFGSKALLPCAIDHIPSNHEEVDQPRLQIGQPNYHQVPKVMNQQNNYQ